MIGLGNGVRVFIVAGITDMRCGIAGLCARAKRLLEGDPASGAVSVFCGRMSDRLKILHLDGQGCYFYYKVLERGQARTRCRAVDHLPLYRLNEIFARTGADIPDSTLSGWCGSTTKTLTSLVDLLRANVMDCDQVLRLLETFEMADLQVAVKNTLRMGAIGFDAIKHLVLCQIEKRRPKLDLDVYPYLPKANVGTTSAASYMSLLRVRAA